MANVGASFEGEVFRKDFPIVIATNRQSAIILPVRLRYDSDGYVAGQILAQNSTDNWFQKYDSGGSSGTDTAVCVLFESHPTEDFDGTGSTGSTMAAGIFGGCVLYKDKLIDYDTDARTDLKAVDFKDATGTNLTRF